nr:chromate efflux transporter [Janthinobacterium sp. Marseille]
MSQPSPVDTPASSTAPEAVSFTQALALWFKLGFLGFGGPAAQISLMHRELVEQRRWISEKRFLHALNYCMLLPGPEAQQLATYMGWLMHRSKGGIAAGLLFVLPSLFFLITLSWLYIAYGHLPLIAGLFYGIKPAITAVVIHAVHRIGSRALKNGMMWAIAAASFIAIFVFNIPFPLIIACAALLAYLGSRYMPQKFSANGSHGQPDKSYGAALIDDDTPPPAHAQFRWAGLYKILLIGGLLWCVPMAVLALALGWQHTLTQMGWFFTKAALLTFGGAYAVLPYIYQGAITHYNWLTPTQMIDGLALGEANPGPLIMVVAFVGFVGAYVQAIFGPELQFIAGATAAVLVTWFTFLPSFIFILAGGPLVESTHGNLKFTAPLSGITAAVVGVILNLGMFFAYHVLWPTGFTGDFDWIAALMAIAAAIALLHYKRKVIHVIAASALLGLLLKTVVL